MQTSQITSSNQKGKNKNNSKNTIHSACHDKSTTNTNHTVFKYYTSTNPTHADWTTRVSKRNRLASSNPSSPDPDPNKNNKKLFITTNRYEPLTQTESVNSPANPPPETPTIVDKIILPPSIFVKGVINFPNLGSYLIEIIGVDNFFCKSSSDSLKI